LRRRRDIAIIRSRGKGGHVRVERGQRVTHVPTASGELKTGLLHGILKQLGLTIDDLR
jgi:predicted RNA binding protein YcfA (HicA-like mRNA interferase family)